jgi:hypothetical protein
VNACGFGDGLHDGRGTNNTIAVSGRRRAISRVTSKVLTPGMTQSFTKIELASPQISQPAWFNHPS